jgi:hypothetical protein
MFSGFIGRFATGSYRRKKTEQQTNEAQCRIEMDTRPLKISRKQFKS